MAKLIQFLQDKKFFKDAFGWGFVLWLIGYILGMVLYFIVPVSIIGWILMPIGVGITLWVLYEKVHPVKSAVGGAEQFNRVRYYFLLAVIWTFIAVVFDYLFIVKLLNPADFYYKPDVYLYYALTFILPLLVGRIKRAS